MSAPTPTTATTKTTTTRRKHKANPLDRFPFLPSSLAIKEAWELTHAADAIPACMQHAGEFLRWEPRAMIKMVGEIAERNRGEEGLRAFRKVLMGVWGRRVGEERERGLGREGKGKGKRELERRGLRLSDVVGVRGFLGDGEDELDKEHKPKGEYEESVQEETEEEEDDEESINEAVE